MAGGGDWGTGAGGYTSSAGDNETITFGPSTNGLTASLDEALAKSNSKRHSNSAGNYTGGIGASYYSEGYASGNSASTDRARGTIVPAVGGQGGVDYGWFVGGSGGVAGSGGTVTVSSSATIYAFNGDRITNSDYTTTNSNYDASDVLTYKSYTGTSENFIEAYIYAQAGTLRDVYCITAKWGEKPNHNYSYFYGLFGSTCSITGDYSNPTAHDDDYFNVLVRAETTTSTTGYINAITGNNQGIGSGAGYIELSNGTYTVTD